MGNKVKKFISIAAAALMAGSVLAMTACNAKPYALENPLCKELLTSYTAYKIGNQYTLYSTWYSGRFKDNPNLSTVKVSGGKTGYIDESGFCLVSYAIGKSTGKKYIQVIVGQPSGSGLTESKSVVDIKYVYNNFAS